MLPMFFCLLLFMGSCNKELEEYYKTPNWLKGNAYELLESKGNHSIFLEAVQLSGYTDVISGKGIITVMAPTDEAFSSYLSDKGYGSVKDIPSEELQKLVGFHLVYYSFNKEKFADYRPEGISSTPENITDAGLHYKFRTKSSSGIEEYVDNTIAPGQVDSVKKVYHKEIFLPIFSTYLFETKNIDPVYNYQYFYPDNEWNVEENGFCVSNSGVIEYEQVTDNGYVYTLNKVLTPLETIYEELENSTDFILFKELYDKFADFQYNEGLSNDYGNGSDIYLFYHTDLPKIASEWSYNGESTLPDYADLEQLSREANNVFAPSDEVLADFFNSFWAPYYSSIYNVGFLPVKYLLDNLVYEGDIVFPQEIEEGRITTKFGTPIQFNTSEVVLRKVCANGTLYGLNSLTVPDMFKSVTAPAFQNPDYRIFLYMLDQSEMVLPLMSDNLEFNLFLPSDKILEDNTVVSGKRMLYQNTNPNKYGKQTMMIEGDDQPWITMKTSIMDDIVKNHVASALMTSVGDYKIYKTLNAYQYLLVENDNKVFSSYIYNNYPDSPQSFHLNSKKYNGNAYDLTGETEIALVQDYSLFKEQISKNPPLGLEYFKQMVGTAQFNTTVPPFNFMQGERFIAFVPENDVVLKYFNQIPLDPEEMSDYLKYYFVKVAESSLPDYPFPGAGIEGELITFKNTRNGYAKLQLVDNGDNLQVIDGKGNVINIKGIFPRIYNDGAVYLIDRLLEFE
jgi:uncharacterized surface protein with fasciclin (FAS1) repeats